MRCQHCCRRQYAIQCQNGLFRSGAQLIGLVFILWVNLDGKADVTIFNHDAGNRAGGHNVAAAINGGDAAQRFGNFSLVQLLCHS